MQFGYINTYLIKISRLKRSGIVLSRLFDIVLRVRLII